LFSLTTSAMASSTDDWHLSGYGTLGLVHEDNSGAAFIREQVQTPKDTTTTHPFLTDSRIGLQAAYVPDSDWEFISQLVFRHQTDKSLDGIVEWFNVGYKPNDMTKLRLGRVGWDAFLMSDHRHLGFAYPWVRPPVEFYGSLPIYRLDGIDFSHKFVEDDSRSQWIVKGQLGKGATVFPIGDAYDFESDIWSISLYRKSPLWTFRAGYSELDVATSPAALSSIPTALSVIDTTYSPSPSLTNHFLQNTTFKGTSIKYSSLGLIYDDGQWIAQTELGHIDTDTDMVTNGDTGYIAIGKRINNFIPFFIFSAFETSAPVYQNGPYYAALDGYVNGTRIDQQTLSAGLRWDVSAKTSVKFQWDHTHIEPNGYALWFNNAQLTTSDEDINVFTLTLDFVF